MTASEKVAYLMGLAEGLGIDENSNEGKLMLAMIDVMKSLASDVEDLEANMADMADAMDELSEDIAYVEDLALSDDEEDFDYDEDDVECDPECDGDCSCCGGCGEEEAELEVTCPTCGAVTELYPDDIEFGSIICPACGEDLEFEFDEEDDED